MKPFNKDDYEKLLKRLKSMIKPILPLNLAYNPSDINVISIRHDVDDDLFAAYDMAKLEKKHKIHASYYILNDSKYWNEPYFDEILYEIKMMGHEVAWHNNAISTHLRTDEPLKDVVKRSLNKIKMAIENEVWGSASHGDKLCHQWGYLNYYIFKGTARNDRFPAREYTIGPMIEFGLLYEAYHTGHTHYVSESGGEWSHGTEDKLLNFENNGGKLQILVHPQWWQL